MYVVNVQTHYDIYVLFSFKNSFFALHFIPKSDFMLWRCVLVGLVQVSSPQVKSPILWRCGGGWRWWGDGGMVAHGLELLDTPQVTAEGQAQQLHLKVDELDNWVKQDPTFREVHNTKRCWWWCYVVTIFLICIVAFNNITTPSAPPNEKKNTPQILVWRPGSKHFNNKIVFKVWPSKI